MGWAPGIRVTIRERGGTIVVAPAADGVHRIDDRGYLLLPLAVRVGLTNSVRLRGLRVFVDQSAGDRVTLDRGGGPVGEL